MALDWPFSGRQRRPERPRRRVRQAGALLEFPSSHPSFIAAMARGCAHGSAAPASPGRGLNIEEARGISSTPRPSAARTDPAPGQEESRPRYHSRISRRTFRKQVLQIFDRRDARNSRFTRKPVHLRIATVAMDGVRPKRAYRICKSWCWVPRLTVRCCNSPSLKIKPA